MSEPRPTPRSRRRHPKLTETKATPVWLAAALIVIVGLVAYSNSFDGVFVFDDEPAIARNAGLRSLWPLNAAMSAAKDTTLAGRPVASLTFALDYAFSSGALRGFHVTNLVIHLGAALLLYGIARRTLVVASLRDEFGPRAPVLALVIALLFVVHPLQTSAVTYIVQRVESLMGFFYLATLYAAIRALDAVGRSKILWMTTATLCCALGMGTKEVMVTAPLMVMLWDRQFAPDRLASRRLLHLSLSGTWVILLALTAEGQRASSAGFAFAEMPWWRYLITQSEVVTHYLRLAFLPTPLVLDYEWPAASSLGEVIMPTAFIGVLLVLTLWGLVRRSPAGFAGAWLFVILAPTSSVLPIVTEVAAEHRMYLPLAGVIAFVVLGLFRLVRRAAGLKAFQGRGVLGLAAGAAVLFTVMAFARLTWERNADYRDYDRIWMDTIAKRPQNARARNNLATSLLARGDFAAAEPHLRVAVELRPSYPEAQANLGVALSAQGRYDEGAIRLERALLLRPDFDEARRNLGETYALQRRMAEAVAQYARALEHRPDDVGLLNRAAWIMATARDPRVLDGARARQFAERAVTLTRRQDPDSLDSLGAALAELGEFEAAVATTREALGLARLKGDLNLSRDLESRAALYSRGEPFRDR